MALVQKIMRGLQLPLRRQLSVTTRCCEYFDFDMPAPLPVVIEKEGNVQRVYDIYSRLLKDRIICVNGSVSAIVQLFHRLRFSPGVQINDQYANAIVAQLLFLQSESSHKPITMYINSPGGSVVAGLAIYDTMQYVKPPASARMT